MGGLSCPNPTPYYNPLHEATHVSTFTSHKAAPCGAPVLLSFPLMQRALLGRFFRANYGRTENHRDSPSRPSFVEFTFQRAK
jgi:hypothetical protein